MSYTPFVVPLLFAAVMSAVLSVYLWRRRSVQGVVWLSLLMLLITEWLVAYVLWLVNDGLTAKMISAKIEYIGIVSVPLVWLVFALQYTGKLKRLTFRRLALLAVVPCITLLLTWTNEAHGLIWAQYSLYQKGSVMLSDKTYGAWFWVHCAYSYALMLTGTALVIKAAVSSFQLYRRQTIVMVVGVLVPIAGNIVYVSQLGSAQGIDPTPLSFTLSGLMMAVGIFRFRLAEIVPVARDAVVEGMQDALIVLDTHDRVVDMNMAAQSIIGLPSSKVVGQSVAQLFPAWPDQFGVCLEGTETQSEIMLKEGGEERYYGLRFSPLRNRRGVVTGGTVMLHDITERKKMEEALRRWGELYESLVEATGAAVIRLNREGKRTFVSGSAVEFYGRTREELIGGWVGDNDVSESRETIWLLLQRIFETGEPVRGFVTRQQVEDTIKYVSSNWEPIKDAEGSVVEAQMTATDITEQIEGERQRLEAQRMEALGKMAGGIAHDVNNILAMGVLWAEIAKTKTNSAEAQEAMENIISAARGGSEIMRRLQRFGQPPKAGVQEMVDLSQVVSDSVLFTRPMWKDQSEAKDIYIEVREELLDVPPVRGNSAQIKEAVVNLILNAVEALPGGGELSLRTYQGDDGVCVSVSDTGIGMDEDEKARIFDPYYTTKGEHGTGLGLAAVQGIVRSHGGEVKVSSQKGKGSTFVVCLPVPIKDADEEVRTRDVPDELTTKRASRILVVDDEPLVRKAIGGVLKEQGHLVVAVEDGMKALAAFREEEYGLVLLDLGMPGMNGYQTAEEMKKLKPDVPVMLVTGWGDDVDQDRVKEIGIIRVVHKPFQPDELTQAVEEVLGQRVEGYGQ